MQSQRCVVFDVDGTLTATTGVDDACLVGAWREVFGLGAEVEIDTDWSHYVHSTDEGLTLEVCERGLGRGPTRAEVERVKERFFSLLREKIGEDARRCVAVGGAAAMLRRLREGGWSVGIASGAWEESARIKLRAAGLEEEVGGVPGTFSHARGEGMVPATREEIVMGTLEKLSTRGSAGTGCPPKAASEPVARGLVARAVYVGDGVWDARAAAALGIGFVGMRVDGDETRLRALGVERIVREYGDGKEVERMIREEMGESKFQI